MGKMQDKRHLRLLLFIVICAALMLMCILMGNIDSERQLRERTKASGISDSGLIFEEDNKTESQSGESEGRQPAERNDNADIVQKKSDTLRQMSESGREE